MSAAAFSIRDLFYGLEMSIRERFRVIEDILRTRSQEGNEAALLQRIEALEARLEALSVAPAEELLPKSPMKGLEVVQKAPVASVPAPVAAHLAALVAAPSAAPVVALVAPAAAPSAAPAAAPSAAPVVALAAPAAAPLVQKAVAHKVTPVVEAEIEIDLVSEIAPESEAEAEPEEDAAEEEVAEVELEEFEYKGATYYRDSDNNVFATDDDGELVEEPFGTWNPVKQRIVARKV
jgi:hypothetical protein